MRREHRQLDISNKSIRGKEEYAIVQPNDIIYQKRLAKGDYHASPIVIEKYKLIFFTQRKVACTQWAALFRRMMGNKDYINENPGYGHKYDGLKRLYDYDLRIATKMMNSPEWTKTIFVRDPIQRFVSAYFDKAVHTNYAVWECGQPKIEKSILSLIFKLTRECHDTHWGIQSERMESKYLPLLNFVGHLETVYDDIFL